MFSRILIKLIDQAIVPAILLLAARILSVLLITKYVGLEFSVERTSLNYSSMGDYALVNSYSLLFMVIVLAIGLFYIILKAYVFHESHIAPAVTARLFSFGIPSFIQSSFDLYTQGTIWLSYAYLLMFVTGVMALYSLVYPFVFFVAAALTVVATVLLVIDIEQEMSVAKTKDPVLDNDTRFVNMEVEVE